MNKLCIITLILVWAISAGAVPMMINYQGLVESTGQPFTGTGEFKFALVDDPVSPSVSYWSNDSTSVAGSEPVAPVSITVQNGLYTVIIGETDGMIPLDGSEFSNDAVYLRVWFDDGTNGFQHLSPDQRITSMGFALRSATADDADTVDGLEGADLEESAEIDADIATHAGIADAHHTKTTSFSELTDSATDSQIPNDITLSQNKIRAALSNDFHNIGGMDAVNDADADTTNELQTIQEVLTQGYNAAGLDLVNLGNVGIGTASPIKKLHIGGADAEVLVMDDGDLMGTHIDGEIVQMFNNAGSRTILLDSEAGTGGDFQMFNDDAVMTVDIDSENSDAGTFGVTNGVSSSLKVVLDGDGNNDDGGEIKACAADGSTTLLLDGESDNNGGLVSVRNDVSEETIKLVGDDGTDSGKISLLNREGVLNVETITLEAQDSEHSTGSRIIGRAENGEETFIVDTSDGSTGGAWMQFMDQDGSQALSYSALTRNLTLYDGENAARFILYGGNGSFLSSEQDGSNALYFSNSTKILTLYDSDGTATITFNGQTGAKSGVVKTSDYGQRMLYCVESPEVWFEDFGSGQLINGQIRIDLDPVFLQAVTIDAQHTLKVYITPTDDCNGVFVKKSATYFTVHELNHGSSHATFDWRVVAKRKGLEDIRLEEFRQTLSDIERESPALSEDRIN